MKRKIELLLAFLLLSISCAFAQKLTVKGTVLDETGQTIIGATVREKGVATNGAQTDIDGHFTLTVNQGATIIVSYVGYKTQEVKAAPQLTIKMVPDNELLDEVVVVAYGTTKKESLTGAVSVVKSDQLDKRVSTTVTGALEGAASGIQVNNTYGEPGAAPSIRIRGIGTLGAQAPLFVLDGVPYEGNIAEINSNDIASMSILKDAASTALYGSRAANGVVLITTKTGRGSKPSFTVSTNQGFYTRGLPEYDRLMPKEWMQVSWEAMKNFSMNGSLGLSDADARAYASSHVVADYARRNIFNKPADQLFDNEGRVTGEVLPGYDDLDWAKDIERTGRRQDYNMSGSYSGDNFSLFGSAGYLNEQGYVVASGYERFSARANAMFQPTKWLKTGINVSAVHTDRNYNDNASGNAYKNPFSQSRYMAPVYPVFMHKEDGSYLLDENGEKQYDVTSGYLSNRHIGYELRNDNENTKRNVMGMQTFGTVTFPYGFSATVRGDLNKSTTNYLKYDNVHIGDGAGQGRLNESAYQYTVYTFQQLLNWNYTFDDKHIVELLLGHENFSSNTHAIYGMNTGVAIDDILVMKNFLNNSYFEGFEEDYRTESYLSRLKYNYDNKYILEGSFRRDGSSRFHPDRRWGNFFSAGASWNISAEDFMKDVSWVDFLKLRTSWGQVGNDASVGLYGYMALYEVEKNGGNTALMKRTLDASDIKWETTQTVDVGLEGRLFDRLDFNLGFFDKRSIDLLFDVQLPLSAGSTPSWTEEKVNQTVSKNIGTISNSGVELSLNFDIIKSQDLTWSIGTEGTFIKNKVIKLPDGKDVLRGMQKVSEGHSIYEYFTYHFVGVDQLTGRSLYTLDPDKKDKAAKDGQLVTINGTDYALQNSYALRDWSGSALPDYYGSFNTSLKWKGLSVYALFTYSLGGKLYDGAYQSLMSTSSASSASANHIDLLKSWKKAPAGMTETSADRIDPNGIPQIDFANSNFNNALSDRWLTDASYMVFKNLNVSYTLPNRLTEPLTVQQMTVTLGAENLFTLTARKGINPQNSFSGAQDDTYVTARVYSLGLSFKF